MVSIAYTGSSYIGLEPTDQWLAGRLTQLAFGPHGRPVVRLGGAGPSWDIGLALQTLKQELDTAPAQIPAKWQRQWYNHSFEVSIVGWQCNSKGRCRPLLAFIQKPERSKAFKIEYGPRHWYKDGKFRRALYAAPAENISHAKIMELFAALSPDLEDYRIAETFLAQVIREVSANVPEVGPDCMSIAISPPGFGEVRIKYITERPTIAQFISAKATRELSVAFTPWIIGPDGVLPPSLHRGGEMTYPVSGYTVVIEGTPHEDGPYLIFSQERPKLG